MTPHRLFLVLGLLAAICSPLMAAAPPVPSVVNTSYATPQGERILRHVGLVAVDRETVWKTFTTSEGLREFLAPVTAIDLRIGGHWEASYDPRGKLGDPGNIINEIISYLPAQMLSIRILQAPPTFKHADEAKQLWTVIQFDKGPGEGPATVVTISMLGFKQGAAWDDLYKFFDRGNAYTLVKLQERFVKH